MWRAGNRDEEDLGDEEPLRAPVQITQPHGISIGDPGMRVVNVAEPTWDAWRAELAAVGGVTPLLHFVDTPRTRIELSSTHPGGLAQFITGKTTLLSNLIRDEVALRTAKIAAGAIAAKSLELSTARGIDGIHLGIGLVEWRHEDADYCAPLLLRPLAIRRAGRDFELKLRGAAVLNPQLHAALLEQFQLDLDEDAFVALTDDDGSFKPNAVIDRLRGLTGHLEWFNVSPRLIVSSFVEVASAMVADAATLEHPLLDALAGNPTAKVQVEEAYSPVPVTSSDTRPPQSDTLLLEADTEQENVVTQIAAGNSLVVKTLPGTGGTQTIVNAIGNLVGQNKRVLVVSARRSSLHGINQRLSDVGLTGLAVSPATLRRDMVRSISRIEKSRQPMVGDVDEALVRLRKVMLDYRSALTRPDEVLGITVLDCVQELSRLSLLPMPPRTTARLSRATVEALAVDRHRASETMVTAAALGEFRYGPGDSPWYGAQFPNGEAATRAHALARQLHEELLPRLLGRAQDLIRTTYMRPFENISELGAYLSLLIELRETLDRFLPDVFDRSLTELIIATAARRDNDMSSSNRRRLKKLAKEYIRPGVHVGDLHESLVKIQQQRILWQRFVAEGVPPEVPVGIADVQAAYAEVARDLAQLNQPLGLVVRDNQLEYISIGSLLEKLEALAAESDVLNNLQERSALMATLRDLQIEPLTADLAARHVPDTEVEAELEQAWWQSALESLLSNERALLGANTAVLDRLEADFRLVDEAHAAGSAQLLAWQLAENWKIGLVDWPDEAGLLKKLLRSSRVTSFDLQTTAPHPSRTVAPVWLASPYEVHEIVDTLVFDTVILVDAGATTIAENAGAIRRAKQVVAFGDPVTQSPAPFETSVLDPEDVPVGTSVGRARTAEESDEWHADSALARLGGVLPGLSLTRSFRAGGEDLAELVNRRFYGGKIQSLPWAGSFLGHGSIALDFIKDGSGMPDGDTGAVESVDAEVDRVVELVIAHASTRPQESLMVITASARHAVRVQQAILGALASSPELTEFVVSERAEPFMVATIEQAVAESRDRVIFSIGYGRTPHGRVLSDFGALGEPGGERLLAVAMTRARRYMVIVSCFQAADIDDSRMHHGAIALAEILDEIGARADEVPLPDDSDPMLVDLAQRLEARGLNVALGHRGKLGLVASHLGMCLAIETDTFLMKSSLRESLRMRPELLRRLGWHYLRVHVFELFSDPDAVASKVVTLLGAENVAPATGAMAAVASAAATTASQSSVSQETPTQPTAPQPRATQSTATQSSVSQETQPLDLSDLTRD